MKRLIKLIALALAFVLIGGNFLSVKMNEVEAADVNKDMLDVKVQVSSDGTIMRFLSSVDSLNYSEVGFKVTPENETTKTYSTKKVYERIASTTESVTYEFSPKVVDTTSEYFVTAKMNATVGKNYTVQAYVVSLDGQTTTYGMGRCVAVSDAQADTDLNLSFASTATVTAGTTLSVTYGASNASTTAIVIGSDGETVYVRVAVDKEALPSATLFTFSGSATGSTIYRNLYTKYVQTDGTKKADTTWYDVYSAAGETEFTIATVADFYGFAALTNASTPLHFDEQTVYLIADMEINTSTAMSGITGEGTYNSSVSAGTVLPWTPIANSNALASNKVFAISFDGTFDGQGHTISGVAVVEGASCTGLFGAVGNGGTIKNLVIANSFISNNGNGYCGTIADATTGGTFDSIYVKKGVQVRAISSGHLGGIVGTARDDNTATLTIQNCWFAGHLFSSRTTTAANMGSMLGWAYAVKDIQMNNCLYTGTMTSQCTIAGAAVGGMIGKVQQLGNQAYQRFCYINNTLMAGSIAASSVQSGAGAIFGNVQDSNTTVVLDSVYSTNSLSNMYYSSGKLTGSVIATTAPVKSDATATADLTANGWVVVDSLTHPIPATLEKIINY